MFAISLAEVCNLDSQEKRDAQRKLQDLRDAQQLGDNQSRAMIVEAVEDLRTVSIVHRLSSFLLINILFFFLFSLLLHGNIDDVCSLY